LELILQNKAPRAIVLRDNDGLVCVGALVAQEIFHKTVPDIICLGTDGFSALLQEEPRYGQITDTGAIIMTNYSDGTEEAFEMFHRAPVESSFLSHDMTEEESHMLESAANEAERMALRVLIRYAKITASSPLSTRYIYVAKAHIDGCTYIGPGGLELVQQLVKAGGQVKVPTTLNSVSADRSRWQALGVPADRALASIAVGDAYLALGACHHSFTCAPYLLSDPPQLGQDIVWGESNAVVYANTVLGAKTEKYADYLDICCAIVGKVPAAGVHLAENRLPRIVLDATDLLQQLWIELNESREDIEILFPVLGHLCGSLSDGHVPILLGFNQGWAQFVTPDHLKSFCAAYGTTGTSPLIHIAGITPEAKDGTTVDSLVANCDRPTRAITMLDLRSTFDALDSSETNKVDLVALGNPHLSLTECEHLANLVDASQKDSKRAKARIMACMSRALYEEADKMGYVSRIESFGVEFVNDTCWCMLLDAPIIPQKLDSVIMTNSGKYAHYGPGLTQKKFRFGSMQECVKAAATGRFVRSKQSSDSSYPTWLSKNYVAQRRGYSMLSQGAFDGSVSPWRQYRIPRVDHSKSRLILKAASTFFRASVIR
jgi:predicted aconitase